MWAQYKKNKVQMTMHFVIYKVFKDKPVEYKYMNYVKPLL
jgi:hypothetical protein